jgi:hypothetical protein
MRKTQMSEVIPPGSKFKLVRSETNAPMWRNQIGRIAASAITASKMDASNIGLPSNSHQGRICPVEFL